MILVLIGGDKLSIFQRLILNHTLSSRGRMPVAMYCKPISEEIIRARGSRHDGLPRRTVVLLAMTRKSVIIRHPRTNTPCHREGVARVDPL